MKCKNCKNLTKRIDSDGILYDSCEIIVDCPDTERERDCKYYTAATNADRIRAMTDEELAAWFFSGDFPWCVYEEDVVPCTYEDIPVHPCDRCLLNWLKQEAE